MQEPHRLFCWNKHRVNVLRIHQGDSTHIMINQDLVLQTNILAPLHSILVQQRSEPWIGCGNDLGLKLPELDLAMLHLMTTHLINGAIDHATLNDGEVNRAVMTVECDLELI